MWNAACLSASTDSKRRNLKIAQADGKSDKKQEGTALRFRKCPGLRKWGKLIEAGAVTGGYGRGANPVHHQIIRGTKKSGKHRKDHPSEKKCQTFPPYPGKIRVHRNKRKNGGGGHLAN